MMQIEQIKEYFPPYLRDNSLYHKYLMKEYIQLLILDFLSDTKWVKKLTFIGGTNLRLVKGIDRFSEDIDFDCKEFSEEEFSVMTDEILLYLMRLGFNAEIREKDNRKLTAFGRSFYFPGFLFELGLSAHREERFLIKVECQDRLFNYSPVIANIKGCGFYFSFPVPDDSVLCAMKISALLSRSKGRDFYDVMFLLSRTAPDYAFLKAKYGITNMPELKKAFYNILGQVDLSHKSRDFEHLLFEKRNSLKILAFEEFVRELGLKDGTLR